jgi:hypothetical protein
LHAFPFAYININLVFLGINNPLTNTTPFMLIIAKSMTLPTTKLCAVCLGIIRVKLGNKCLFPKLCPLMAKFANVIEKSIS